MTQPAQQSRQPAETAASSRLVRGVEAAALKPLYPVARLIKGAVLEAEQARAEARQLLEQARLEAERMRRDAESQAAATLNAAQERGLREGFDQFRRLIEQATKQVDGLGTRFSDEVTRVAFRIAREVLGAELQRRPQSIMDVVRAGIEHLRARFPQRIVVHLHPDDFALVDGRKDEFIGDVAPDTRFNLVKDSNVERHGVVLETEMGHYDMSIESQLDELRKVLRAGEEKP